MSYFSSFLVILSLIFPIMLNAQIDFEFFELNNKGEAKALIQRQIDTIEVNDDLVISLYELEKTEVWDTAIIKNNYYVVTEKTNIQLIQGFGEIKEEYIIVKPASSMMKPINCDIDWYDKIMIQKEVLPKSNVWICKNDLLNTKSWNLDNIPSQKDSISKYVLKMPILTKTIDIPMQYIKIRTFRTNKSLTEKEIKILESECTKQTLFPYKSTRYKEVIKETKRYPNQYNSYKIIQNGSVKTVKIITEAELDKVIIPLKKALQDLGYSITINNKIDSEFKLALMQFQMENGLPIGQFDRETVRFLLEE